MPQQNHGIQVISSKTEIEKYLRQAQPKLRLVSENRIEGVLVFAMKILSGQYILLDPLVNHIANSTVIQDEYTISIEWNQNGKPYPIVKELGNRIINSLPILMRKLPSIKDLTDLHVYKEDNSLCLCASSEYEVRFPCGIKINEVIEDLVIPFLYYQSYLTKHFKEPYSGRGHGVLGILEYLDESRNIPKVGEITFSSMQRNYPRALDLIRRKKPSSNRNCICGSSIKGKKCHWSATRGAKILYEYCKNL
jgi:hypothetical protein